jgi:hypothetical protein
VRPHRFHSSLDCGCGVSRLAVGQEGLLSCPVTSRTIRGYSQIVSIRGAAISASSQAGTAGSMTRLVTEAQRHAVVRDGKR